MDLFAIECPRVEQELTGRNFTQRVPNSRSCGINLCPGAVVLEVFRESLDNPLSDIVLLWEGGWMFLEYISSYRAVNKAVVQLRSV